MPISAPADVDEYLSRISSPNARQTLEWMRGIIREEAPEAEELIRYGIPTYKLNGFVGSIAAFKNHCSFFPGHTVRSFEEELKGYKTAKGTVQFPHDSPPPEGLIRAIVRARVAENLSCGLVR